MDRKFVIGIVLTTIILIVAGIFLVSKEPAKNSPQPVPVNSQELLKVTESDRVKGSREARVALIEYSDFQCPACKAYYPVLKQLIDEFGDKVTFVYRNFPLRQIHQNAQLASQAAEAAGKQDKFWEMHDLIFENQEEWSKSANPKEIFAEYADGLNLDVERFKTDLDSQEVKDKVDNDYRTGTELNINGTPAFFLNNDKLPNPQGFEDFKNIIQKAIPQ